MIKLSIIIPVYNVEDYVERCVVSCCNQNIDIADYELIIINDGSPDKSIDIVRKLAKNYKNIIIASQSNQGLSAARNLGMKMSRGEYIWFVDSDDWIKKNCVVDMYNKCKEFDLDVLLFDANDCNETLCMKRATSNEYDYFPINGKNYLTSSSLVFPVCFKIFKREFLISNNLFFMHGIMHEDNEFIPRIFYFAKNIMRTNNLIYNVFQNVNSITRSVNPKKSFDLLKVAQSHADFINVVIKENDLKVQFCNYIGLAINSALNNVKYMDKKNTYSFYSELYRNKHLFYYMKNSNNTKYKIEAQIYLLSPQTFKILYSIFS